MSVRANVHPAVESLRAYGLGKLTDSTVADLIFHHLETCAECRSKVAAVSSDCFVQRMRDAHAPAGHSIPTRAGNETAVSGNPARPSATTSPFVPDLPPELQNHPQYEVQRELGRGGMGVVYLAKNKLMERLEVLKVMSRALLDREGGVERFLREIRSAAMLNHPNVATAYSALQVGDLFVFAMEYIEGEDLAKSVKARGPLPVVNACYYVQQAGLGLQHAFEKGMVHRDIKPQNLIMARGAKRQVVKVLDFGLAKVIREKGEDKELTGTGRMLGTPEYIAPEQAMDAAHADIRADIYGLGCTLYYLLAGHAPFKGRSLYEILHAHQTATAKPLNELRPDVPAELAAVVAKMIAKKPEERYQTPMEAAQALLPFIKAGPRPAVSRVLSSGKGTRIGADASHDNEFGAGASKLSSAALPAEAPKKSKKRRQGTKTVAARRWRRPGALAAAVSACVALILMAVILVKLQVGPSASGKTTTTQPAEEAFVILDIDQPGAEVRIDGGKITHIIPGDKRPFEVALDPKKPHTLEVKRDGFAVYKQDIELKVGESKPIKVSLRPNPPPPSPPALFVIPSDVEGPVYGAWEIKGKELVQPRWVWGGRLLFGDKKWADYDFTVDAQMRDRNCGFGMMFRNTGVGLHVDPGDGANVHKDYLIFVVGAFGNTHHCLQQILDSNSSSLGNTVLAPDQQLKNGEWYTARVSVRGNRVQCYLQGEKLFDVLTNAPPAGLPGLMTWDAAYTFRNIKITDPSGKVLLEGVPGADDLRVKP
jgi:serine/threonine protein kinase